MKVLLCILRTYTTSYHLLSSSDHVFPSSWQALWLLIAQSELLVALTQTAFPARRWTLEDLKDVLDAAIQGTSSGRVKVVEGRYFRKRVREQCAVSERYRESFALVILTMRPEPYDGVYQSILDAVIERFKAYADILTVHSLGLSKKSRRPQDAAFDHSST